MSKARDTITRLWAALDNAADHSGPASGFLMRAFDAAVDGERQHRRGSGKYKESVETAARYFVLKWALEGSRRGLWDSSLKTWEIGRERASATLAGDRRIRHSVRR